MGRYSPTNMDARPERVDPAEAVEIAEIVLTQHWSPDRPCHCWICAKAKRAGLRARSRHTGTAWRVGYVHVDRGAHWTGRGEPGRPLREKGPLMAAVDVIEEQLYEDFLDLPTHQELVLIALVGLVAFPFELARIPLRAARTFFVR